MLRGLVVLLALLVAAPAAAHPGRLDAEGCHQVHTRFVHQSGTVDDVGTRHCHRTLGGERGAGMRLDGREQLLNEPQRPPARQRPSEPR